MLTDESAWLSVPVRTNSRPYPSSTASPELSRYVSCFLDHAMPSHRLLLFLSTSCRDPLKTKAFLEMEGIFLLYSGAVNAKILS